MSKISTERVGHILKIGFDRADKYNAFDLDMWRELSEAFAELDQDDELRCAVVYGNGKQHYIRCEPPDQRTNNEVALLKYMFCAECVHSMVRKARHAR